MLSFNSGANDRRLRWRSAWAPGHVHIGQCSLPDAFTALFVAQRMVQHPDAGVIRMQQVAAHDVARAFDSVQTRPVWPPQTSPQGWSGMSCAHAGEDVVLAI